MAEEPFQFIHDLPAVNLIIKDDRVDEVANDLGTVNEKMANMQIQIDELKEDSAKGSSATAEIDATSFQALIPEELIDSEATLDKCSKSLKRWITIRGAADLQIVSCDMNCDVDSFVNNFNYYFRSKTF